jgi:hypothetical protein
MAYLTGVGSALAELPAGWQECTDTGTSRDYYWNRCTDDVSWEHPLDGHFRQRLAMRR